MQVGQDTPNIWETMRAQNAEKSIFEQAKVYAYAYLDQVYDRAVFPTEDAIKQLSIFDEPLPEHPHNADDILRLLHEFGSPATVAQTGGRYFGFVNGSIVPAALAAKWLADVWDQNAALYVISPIAAQLEAVCEKWLVELFGLPADTAAGFVSGTSTATLCGLAAGRNQLLQRQNWDVNKRGLFGAPLVRVVMGKQAHSSVPKALALLGFGQDNIEFVPADAQGRMDVAQVPELDDRTLVILQAGNVNSGGFDPFEVICVRANRAGAWVHIDGAFGLWAAASARTQPLTQGIDKADSWSVDAHKTLNAPYDCGVVLCRDRVALVTALQASGSYIQYSERRDPMLYVPEMSRRARGIELWATLKFLGKRGVAALVNRLCDHAVQFAEQLRAADFRILNDVVFNQVLVACDTPEQTRETLRLIQQGGECWCGGSVWNDEPVIRISVCSWATTSDDVKRCVAEFVRVRDLARNATSDTDN